MNAIEEKKAFTISFTYGEAFVSLFLILTLFVVTFVSGHAVASMSFFDRTFNNTELARIQNNIKVMVKINEENHTLLLADRDTIKSLMKAIEEKGFSVSINQKLVVLTKN